MNLSAPFIRRPIGTMLLTVGIALAGVVAFFGLPVAPLPAVDFPTIQVSASMPGASPSTMASTVAAPLERHLGTIAGVTEMTSRSSLASTSITLQFDLSRDIGWCRARCPGGDQCRARRSAGFAQDQSDLSQAESRRGADPDPGTDLADAQPRPDLRCGVEHRPAAAAAGQRRRQCRAGRCGAARRAHRIEPDAAGARWHRPGGCPHRARIGQRPIARAGCSKAPPMAAVRASPGRSIPTRPGSRPRITRRWSSPRATTPWSG